MSFYILNEQQGINANANKLRFPRHSHSLQLHSMRGPQLWKMRRVYNRAHIASVLCAHRFCLCDTIMAAFPFMTVLRSRPTESIFALYVEPTFEKKPPSRSDIQKIILLVAKIFFGRIERSLPNGQCRRTRVQFIFIRKYL